MVIVDLITGFLGAGKTTFIHSYIQYLRNKGENIRIIENEFGESNIDTHFLEDEHLEIEDLAGLCMCCVGKSAFIRMLEDAAKSNCDRIIVEPSGIYDVDEFFDTLSLPQLQPLLEIGSIITIVDPLSLDSLTKESKYLMFTQLLASGSVILSKTQYLEKKQIEAAKSNLNQLMVEFGCDSGIMSSIYTKPWDTFTLEDYKEIADSFYNRFVHDRMLFNHMEVFQSLEIDPIFNSQQDLKESIMQVFQDPACGMIYRIKGYTKDNEQNIYEVNCTAKTISIEKVNKQVKNKLIIIGEHIKRRPIYQYMKSK